MKKLMIAAVATAMVGAAYAGCERPEITTNNCAEVYDVVMNLKTTKCLCQARTKTYTVGTACIRGTSNETYCASWRSIVTKKVYGVIWNCECTCSEDLDKESPLLVTPDGWNYDLDAHDSQGNQYFWMPSEKIELDSYMAFAALQRIGAANGKVEAWGTFGDGVNFAGFGTHGALRTKTLSGAVAGCWGAPYDCAIYPEEVVKCPAYNLCTLLPVEDDTLTAVYGTFTVKYNNAKSIKLAKGGDLQKDIGVIPAQWKKLTPKAMIPEYEAATAAPAP